MDYVLLWGLRDAQLRKQTTESILSQLDQGYDLIYVSPRLGLMKLYQRKDLTIGAEPTCRLTDVAGTCGLPGPG